MDCAIIIPTLNPTDKLVSFVHHLKLYDFKEIIIVDDGSILPYSNIFERLALLNVTILHHKKNLGKGAALKTGFSYLRDSGIGGFVTADSDGQHAPLDVYRIACAVLKSTDKIVLGYRNFSLTEVPFKSRLGNRFSSFFFKAATGVTCMDTQTGLRGIPTPLLNFALSIDGNRYDYEMNFLIQAAKSGVSFDYLPIETIYEDKNDCSHFRPVRDSFLIFKEPLKFTMSSFCSALVDIGTFYLFTNVLLLPILSTVFWANIGARCISGFFNFNLNKHWSFQSAGMTHIEFVKYSVLFLSQMLLSSFLVTVFSVFPLPTTVIKILVDCFLFVFSYLIQKKIIFIGGIYETQK